MAVIAESIVYRHPCDCGSASRPLAEGEEPEHRFDVDGEPFPFGMHPDGPRFARIDHGLIRVDVRIYPVLSPSNEWVRIGVDANLQPHLFIGDAAFPWAITEDGFTIHASRHTVAYVDLAFLAKSVDTDGPVVDERVPVE